ncbi:MAG: hypothetical protein BGP05_12430 [Rhizobiales bacterium 62-47]|nr:hypothetical protein [Hyphomicrobiales bacterium]OJY11310.1 MAG: hypothetical protein BGP05_12430 [Rhizobiales bacterium 62-47]
MRIRWRRCRILAVCVGAMLLAAPGFAAELSLAPSSMSRVGSVDARFQSYNVEMVEVTGGRFWKPYDASSAATAGPERVDDAASRLFAYRAPINLTNARLRRLAAALGPAYVRISGTWANSTYFADSDNALQVPPDGFNGVLTRQQWHDVVDFAQAVDAEIVTSFAVSRGARDENGVWNADQARRLIGYTRGVGGRIAAVEFMNEPDLATIGGLPPGYDASAYRRDFAIFRAFIGWADPSIKILGPGLAGQAASGADWLAASASGLDVFSYHHYGALSERCGGDATPANALSDDWLARTDAALAFQRGLHDRFTRGKPIWLTETAEAACGGNRWAKAFLDTFRYLDQLGRLARQHVQVVMHNTLAASNYGLLDETTLAPRPNYWGALLWRRLMGPTVLDAGVPPQPGLHVYAHCLRDVAGGVAVLVINNGHAVARTLRLPLASQRYTLDATELAGTQVRLNGLLLALTGTDELPSLDGSATAPGAVTFAPATITFLALPDARNAACR